MKFVPILLALIQCIACEPYQKESKKTNVVPADKTGIVKSYDKAGNLHTMITYENGIKHGISYLYHKGSDQIMLKMPYQNGQREGKAIKYYKDGQIYAITPYARDEVNGVVKLFFSNGNLKAEIPYLDSRQGLGLKEYLTNGTLKNHMPEITIRKEYSGGQLTYYFSIQDCSNANFYVGSLLKNQFLIDKLPFATILPFQNGEASYQVSDTQIGNTINVICQCRTRAKNPYVTREIIKLGE